jgi:hypothetical protein
MQEQRVILDDSLTPETFAKSAQEAGWQLTHKHPESESNTLEHIYRAGKDGESTVHYIEDQFVKVRYALARGPDASALAKTITDLFPHGPDDRVLAAAEDDSQSPQYSVDWLMSATVLGNQAGHARLRKLIEKRLAHENPGVRRAALIAVSWLEWPDFRSTVDRMAKEDQNPETREIAAGLAKSYGLRDEKKL